MKKPFIVCGQLEGIFTPDQRIVPQWCLYCVISNHAVIMAAMSTGNRTPGGKGAALLRREGRYAEEGK